MKYPLLILLTFFGWIHTLSAMDKLHYTVTSIGEDSGVQTEEVRRLFQDKEGYLWIGTSNGLYKFDGYKAQLFSAGNESNQPFINTMVHCFAEGSNHILWLGSNNGLIRHHKVSGASEYIEEFRNQNVTSIVIDKKGLLWIGTYNGLWSYNPDTCEARHYNYSDDQNVIETVQQLFIDSKGYIWIACWERGLYRFDPTAEIFHVMPRLGTSNSPHCLLEDNRGILWIGTWRDGLFSFDLKEKITNVQYKQIVAEPTHPKGLQSSIIYALGQDSKYGYIWVGGRNGLSILCDHLDSHSFVNITEGGSRQKGTISGYDVNSIVMSPSMNSVWLGILGGGIDRIELKELQFKSIELPTFQQEFGRLKINKLIPVGGSKLWISIPRKTILEVTLGSEEFQPVHKKLGVAEAKTDGIFCWAELSPGDFIFSTYEGCLFRAWFTPEGELKRVLEYPFRRREIAAFVKNGDDILLCTNKRIGIINASGEIHYLDLEFTSQPRPDYTISDLKIDKTGNVWVGTLNDGIYHMQLQADKSSLRELKYHHLSPKDTEQNGVNRLYFDSFGRLWAGSNFKGLFLFNTDKSCFESISKTLLIPFLTNVYDIIEDKNGRLWLDTNKGILSLSIHKNGNVGDIAAYDTADGLLNMYCSSKSFALTNAGVLAFGTRKGVNYLDHFQLSSPRKPLSPIITNIKIHNRDFAMLSESERERISLSTPGFEKKLRLRYNENNICIEFAAMKVNRPKQLLYAYKLEGLDHDWIVTSAQNRMAIYNYLQPGKYRFKVKVSEDHLVWNEEEVLAEIIIVPAWWRSIWAYLVYGICFMVIIIYIYRFFLYRSSLKQEVLIKEIENRSIQEMAQVKLQFFTNISHELLTPLTIISTSIEGLKKKFKSDDPSFAIATSNVERLLRLFEQILEFRKAETRNLKLKVSEGDVAAYIHSLSDKSFRPLALQKNLHYSVVASPQRIWGYFDEDKLSKILFNLLSNAIKYTPQLGTIQLTLQWLPETNEAEFHVHDTGMGIEEDQLPHIFRRFYDGEYRKAKTSGHGIGLSLTKELVDLHHGVISVESKINVGTDFRFTLPLSKEVYSKEEIDSTIAPLPGETDKEEGNLIPTEDRDSNQAKRTLLLVEDNQDLLISMVSLLNDTYDVRTATQGEEAWAVLEEEEIDVVLTDIVMPVMDGVTLCRRLKGDVRYCHIPVVLLTAQNTVEDRVKGYEAGADGYIGKPFNLMELLSKTNALLVNKARFYDQIKQKDTVAETLTASESLDEKFLRQIECYIEMNLSDEELDMDALASAMCVSRSVLYRKIKSLSGDAPSNFVRRIRLNKASLLLRSAELSIGDVAFQVGMPNTKYFSTLFKKEFGVTPSEYVNSKE